MAIDVRDNGQERGLMRKNYKWEKGEIIGVCFECVDCGETLVGYSTTKCFDCGSSNTVIKYLTEEICDGCGGEFAEGDEHYFSKSIHENDVFCTRCIEGGTDAQ